MLKWISTLAVALVSTASVAYADAPKPDANAIVKQSQDAFYSAGTDMKARISMTLTSPGGQKRVRDLTMLRRNEGKDGHQKYFVYFHQPADVRGTAFLVDKFVGKDDDRWLFIPGVNLVKRLAARDAAQSFVGSEFTYEHISGRDLDADNHRLLREEPVAGKDCYVVESVARQAAEYKRKVAWIDKKSYLPLKEEYYNGKDELFKLFTADEVKDVGNIPTIVKRTMANKKSGHSTTVVFTDVSYGVGLESEIFAERYLKDPPKKWIQ
jgi:outer membrane lipoprotein-sorting protein